MKYDMQGKGLSKITSSILCSTLPIALFRVTNSKDLENRLQREKTGVIGFYATLH